MARHLKADSSGRPARARSAAGSTVGRPNGSIHDYDACFQATSTWAELGTAPDLDRDETAKQ